jgi:deoxyribonuclease-4
MRFGFHISIAGGFSKVVDRARIRGCETIQLFSRNPRGWDAAALDREEVEAFKRERAEASISPVFVHLPYLPNLATRRTPFYGRSFKVLCEDLRRAEVLSAPYLVMHMGSRLESDERDAVNTLAEGINRALREVANSVILLFENTSGQGTQIGSRFEEIGSVLRKIENQGRIGLCLDTAHAFGAGYNMATKRGLDVTLRELDRFVGLEKLSLVHLNDTRVPLGSHTDRHWHIGKGRIGVRGFRNIVNDPRLSHLPGIMETPRKNDQEDLENMATMRRLVDASERSEVHRAKRRGHKG